MSVYLTTTARQSPVLVSSQLKNRKVKKCWTFNCEYCSRGKYKIVSGTSIHVFKYSLHNWCKNVNDWENDKYIQSESWATFMLLDPPLWLLTVLTSHCTFTTNCQHPWRQISWGRRPPDAVWCPCCIHVLRVNVHFKHENSLLYSKCNFFSVIVLFRF